MVEQTTTNGNGYVPNTEPLCSFDDYYNLFMKMDKEDLARLLAAKELARQSTYPQFPQLPAYPPFYPNNPSPYPWITWYTSIC